MSASLLGPNILALGDSLTAGYGLKPDEAFPAQLERRLRADFSGATVVNAGVSGNTTSQALARLPRLLTQMRTKPDLAIVALGANDMIRGISPATMHGNLSCILLSLADCSIPTLLAGMLMPRFMGADFARRYNSVFPEVAATHSAAFYPFFLKGVVGDPTLLLPDRVHPNARAVGIIVQNILPAVIDALEGAAVAGARTAA